MKVSDTPRTGSIGPVTYFETRFGQCARQKATPKDRPSNRKATVRYNLGIASSEYGLKLTDEQRELWDKAALNAPSRPWRGQYSHLSGQQFCVQINSTLRCIGRAPVVEPPAPVVFASNPATKLDIVNGPEAGVRLLLNVGAVTEDIMVFGQEPCSRGRMKHRRVYYLGLAGPATNGQSEITGLYTARFGQPAPGQKVFIVTCQTRNGWKAQDKVFSAIVPPPAPAVEQPSNEETKVNLPAAPQMPASNAAPAKPASSLSRAVYKRSTPEVRGGTSGSQVCIP